MSNGSAAQAMGKASWHLGEEYPVREHLAPSQVIAGTLGDRAVHVTVGRESSDLDEGKLCHRNGALFSLVPPIQ